MDMEFRGLDMQNNFGVMYKELTVDCEKKCKEEEYDKAIVS